MTDTTNDPLSFADDSMTAAHQFADVVVEPERDRWGRYMIVPQAGGKAKPYTRATTVAETLDDRYNLELWKVRTTAQGIILRPDVYAELASLPHPVDKATKAKWDKACARAMDYAKGSAGSNLGTALHRFVERINRGEDPKVPAPWDADIAAYREALVRHGLTIDSRYLERVVVLNHLGVAGTFDLIVGTPDGRLRIADLKTGATLDFSWNAIAVQLALYANADSLYDLSTKTHGGMPEVDRDVALVLHLPAGKGECTVYEVDIAAGWEAAQHAMWAREWRKERDGLARPLIIPGGPPAASDLHSVEQPGASVPGVDTVARRADLVERVKALPAPLLAELADKWPRGVPTLAAFDDHTVEQLDAIDKALSGIDWGTKWGTDPQPPPSTLSVLRPVEPTPGPWMPPDEGDALDDATLADLKAYIDRQDPALVRQVTAWSKQANRAGRPFAPNQGATQRRLEILRAAIALAPYEEDVACAALKVVLDGDLQPTVGASLGSLDLDQATRLAAFTSLLGMSVSIIFADEGIRFDGPGVAALAVA